MYQKLMKTYAEIIRTKDTIKNALRKIKKEETKDNVDAILENLSVLTSADTQVMQIKYVSKDREESVFLLNAIISVFTEESEVLIPNGNIKVIEKAEVPNEPISPRKMINIILGFFLGFITSLIMIFLKEYFDNTIKTKDDIEALLDIPIIGVIPRSVE